MLHKEGFSSHEDMEMTRDSGQAKRCLENRVHCQGLFSCFWRRYETNSCRCKRSRSSTCLPDLDAMAITGHR